MHDVHGDGREMFPGADVLRIKGDHFALLNHPELYAAPAPTPQQIGAPCAEGEHSGTARGCAPSYG